MRNNAVLIFGSSGFIGGSLVEELEKSEWIVEKAPQIDFENLDAIKGEVVKFAKKYPGLKLSIVQASWASTQKSGYRDSLENLKWVEFDSILANVALELGIFCIYLGSCLEVSDLTPDIYTQSKLKSLTNLQGHFKNQKFAWLRLYYVFSKKKKRPQILNLAHQALSRGTPILLDSKTSAHDFICVEDVSMAIKFVIINQLAGIQDIGRGKLTKTENLIRATFPDLHISESQNSQKTSSNSYQGIANIDRLLALGWVPCESNELLDLYKGV